MTKLVTGVILTGGRSRRMGRDKGLLELGSRPLIAHVAERLAAACDRVMLAGRDNGRYAFLNCTAVADERPGLGPLGGLLAGLRAMPGDRGVFVACDMPFLNVALIELLIRRADEGGRPWDAVVPRIDGQPEPLHAVYRRSLLPVVTRLLERGGGAPRDLLAAGDVRVDWVEEPVLRAVDPHLLSFFSVDTPQDFELAQRIATLRS